MKNNDFNLVMDQIELNDRSSERIYKQCMEHHHSKNALIRFPKQIAAAVFLGSCLLVSSTAYAAVSAYQEYMSRMSQEEIDTRNDMIQQGEKEADSFSRLLTESEKQRMSSLREKYEEGVCFPNESMPMWDGIDGDAKDFTTPYYDYKRMVFHIPERELSDEEILQIIDVWEKGNYSLQTVEGNESNVSDEEAISEAKENMKDWKHEAEEYEEMVICAFSERFMTDLGIQSNQLNNWETSLWGNTEHLKYMAQVSDGQRKYNIVFKEDSVPENPVVYSFQSYMMDSAEEIINVLSSGNEEVTKTYIIQTAKELQPIIDVYCFGIEENDLESTIQYGYSTDDTTYYTVVFTNTNGDRCRCIMRFGDDIPKEILIYDSGKYDDIELLSEYDMKFTIKK